VDVEAHRDPEEPDDDVDFEEEVEEELLAHPDAPEADVVEQLQPLTDDAPLRPSTGPDVPEADAIEQATPVEYDEDEAPR
jgi:hypothetical protein